MVISPFDVALAGIIFGTTSATVLSLARMKMRMAERNRTSPHVEERLERIEQAVDAIALEVERVAESQRFTTRLLAERLPTPEAHQVAERGMS